MALFEYEVLDREGKIKKGQREAPAEKAIRTNLTQEGLFVVNVRRLGGGGAAAALVLPGTQAVSPVRRIWTETINRLIYRVKVGDLLLFTGQLATMVESGLHLLRSLRLLAEETQAKHFKRAIEAIASDVEGGQSFAGSMQKHPWAFDRIYVSLTRAGEASGQLPAVLNQLTIYLEKVAHLRRKIIGALSYPAVILSVGLLILVIMMIKIVPIFEDVYKRMNATLPLPTLMLIAFSQVVRANMLVSLGVTFLIGVGIYVWTQTEQGGGLLDRAKLRVPVFGLLIRKSILAKVCRTLSTLIQSSVPVLEALEITADVAGNRTIENAIRRIAKDVREGSTIVAAFRQTGQFPSLVIQMVGTGEETGALPAMLGKAALYYEQQVDNTVNTLSSLVEPVMIVAMGAIAGTVITALYLPIFNLGQAIRGGGAAH